MTATETNERNLDIPPDLARRICRAVAKDAIRSGLVDPKGKTDEQLRSELRECIQNDYLERLGGIIIDHTDSLLRQARTFCRAGKLYYACLMYATWAEHWLNGLITTAGQRRGLPDDEITQIIRDTPLRAKLTWLLSLPSLPRIAARHRNLIVHLMDLRNGFVHYKWQGKDDTAQDQERAGVKWSVANFESTVKYILSYEERKIFSASLARACKVV
ncbi:hypothetical protein [Frigoriglobus tundricola]|uniref:RiboL-PSP-HEPN domain-containing protein n=1 Tax=Frigoriglobus tundricola TaxID=2774151 RepID=A0A6M5YWU4_9BACT|nr:hypothetical protein [Frigoriglobus tundricola]QJW97761.1 hypothetical protein FTUN_5339 [Frigoriglobus tundricola]